MCLCVVLRQLRLNAAAPNSVKSSSHTCTPLTPICWMSSVKTPGSLSMVVHVSPFGDIVCGGWGGARTHELLAVLWWLRKRGSTQPLLMHMLYMNERLGCWLGRQAASVCMRSEQRLRRVSQQPTKLKTHLWSQALPLPLAVMQVCQVMCVGHAMRSTNISVGLRTERANVVLGCVWRAEVWCLFVAALAAFREVLVL